MSDHVLILQAREGRTLSLSTVPQPMLRPVRAEAAAVQLFVRYAAEPVGTEKYLGAVQPGGTLTVEYNPDRDRDLVISQIPVSVDGVPAYGQMLDAESIALTVNRMTAPELNQFTDASHTDVSIGIKHHQNAKMLRVEVSEHADMSGALVTFRDVPPGGLGALPIIRSSPGSGALTIYVRISASAGSGYGPPSEIRSVTFANNLGSGGSGGSGGYPPGAILPVEHAE
jgi:hypothetical protein